MKRLHRSLDSMRIPNELAIFEGGHDWAPQGISTEAIEWMQLQAMKAGRQGKDDALVEELFRKQLRAAQASETAKNIYDAYVAYQSLVKAFRGLKDVAEAEAKTRQLEISKEVKAAFASEQEQEHRQRSFEEEFDVIKEKLRDPETSAMAIADFRGAVTRLKKRSEKTTDSGDRRVARRVLQAFFVQCYEEY